MDGADFVSFWNTIYRWRWKGAVSILDQAIYSGSNFVFSILLARWLTSEDYGSFSLAFIFYLFLTGFHNALILEPMSVFGPAKYSHKIYLYLFDQFIVHMIVTSGLGALIFLTGGMLYYSGLAGSFLSQSIMGVGLFLNLMLLMWFARRAFYILHRPGWAFLSSLIYSLVLIGGSFIWHLYGDRSVIGLWGIYGVASLAGMIVLAKIGQRELGDLGTRWRVLLFEQWNYSKWIMLAAFLNFAASQVQIFFTASFLGLNSAGAFRALQNFSLPMLQVITAISILGLPFLAAEFGRSNFRELRRKGMLFTFLLSGIAVFYELVLFFLGHPLEKFLYGGKYMSYAWLIPFVGIVPMLSAVEIGFSIIVRAMQKSVFHAVSTFVMAMISILSGPLLIQRFGVAGAIASQILIGVSSLLTSIYLYRMWLPANAARRIENG